ncbi:hypothetical protein QZH41_003837 [Actinostola sp. cb2023]|nr:hypothetical protein QZH41_003837 [Actinostola sp. cb2023]
MSTEKKNIKSVLGDAITQILMVAGTLFAVVNGLIPSLATLIYGNLVDELGNKVMKCTPINFQVNITYLPPKELIRIDYLPMLGINGSDVVKVLLNGTAVDFKILGTDTLVLQNVKGLEKYRWMKISKSPKGIQSTKTYRKLKGIVAKKGNKKLPLKTKGKGVPMDQESSVDENVEGEGGLFKYETRVEKMEGHPNETGLNDGEDDYEAKTERIKDETIKQYDNEDESYEAKTEPRKGETIKQYDNEDESYEAKTEPRKGETIKQYDNGDESYEAKIEPRKDLPNTIQNIEKITYTETKKTIVDSSKTKAERRINDFEAIDIDESNHEAKIENIKHKKTTDIEADEEDYEATIERKNNKPKSTATTPSNQSKPERVYTGFFWEVVLLGKINDKSEKKTSQKFDESYNQANPHERREFRREHRNHIPTSLSSGSVVQNSFRQYTKQSTQRRAQAKRRRAPSLVSRSSKTYALHHRQGIKDLQPHYQHSNVSYPRDENYIAELVPLHPIDSRKENYGQGFIDTYVSRNPVLTVTVPTRKINRPELLKNNNNGYKNNGRGYSATATYRGVAGANVTKPNATKPSVTHVAISANVTQPSVTNTNVTQPNVTSSNATKPSVTHVAISANVTQPSVTNTNVTQPNVTSSNATKPSVTHVAISANVTQPSVTNTNVTQPNVTSSNVTQRYVTSTNVMQPQLNVTAINITAIPQLNKEDINALRGGLGGQIAFILQNLTSCLSGFVVSFVKSWKLTLLMLLAAPFMGIVEAFVVKVERYVRKKKKDLQDQAGTLAGKGLASIKTVVDFAGEIVEQQQYEEEVDEGAQLNRLKSFVKGFEKGTNTFVAFSFLGLSFWYSTTMLSSGGITPGAILTIRLDGHDIRTLDRRWLRRQLGVVHKNPEFFCTTIAENISYGKYEQCTVKEIVRAAKAAGVHQFIIRLPQGYETVLADDGSPLTPFQLHLLALARALIRTPRVLLWEDDVSLMDPDELRTLTFYLDQARRGRTTVISTSHVSVARLADVIVILHEGRVIEQGTAEELMMSGRAFRYLSTVQYFEAKAADEDRLLKNAGLKTSAQSLESYEDSDDAYEYYKSFEQQRIDHGDQIKGRTGKIWETIRSKREEFEKKFQEKKEKIKEQFLNDTERVVKEGPFYAAMFVVLGTVVAFGGTIEKYMSTLVNERFRQRLEKMAYEKTLEKPAIDPEKQAKEAMDKMQRDVDAMIQKSIGRFIGPEVQSTISSLLTFYIAFSTGWKMTLVALAGYPVIALAQRIQQNQANESIAEPKDEDRLLKLGFRKIASICSLGMEFKFARKFKQDAMEQYKHALKKIMGGGLAFAVGQSTVFIIFAIALHYGCYLITTREMAAIEVLSVLLTVLFGSSASSGSQGPAHASDGTKESANRLFETQPDEPIQVISGADLDMDKASGEIVFHHTELPDPLSKGNLLLNDLDISVKSGQTLAMVLMDNEVRNPLEMLLERYYDPSCGRVVGIHS